MITKALYLYWTNSSYLWKSEKFLFYVVAMLFTATGFGILTFLSLVAFVPSLLMPQVWVFTLAGAAGVVIYWVIRWCHHLKLEASGKMNSKGTRLDKEDAKTRKKELELKERELAIRERELALNFAKELR